MADPTRLAIVEALRERERPVGDIVEMVDIHQSGVVRHLRILHEAGFVQVRPDGARRLYSLRPEPFLELDGWMAGYRRLCEGRLDRFAQALEHKKKARARAANALALGALGVVVPSLGAAATWNAGPEFGPHWYPLHLIAVSLPLSWLGGKIEALLRRGPAGRRDGERVMIPDPTRWRTELNRPLAE